MRRFQAGLIVGKFSPLHRGHEVVFHRAMQDCERVFAISYSKPEFAGCDPSRREAWLKTLFPEVEGLVLDESRMKDLGRHSGTPLAATLPANDDGDEIHRLFVARLCLDVLATPIDAVFTSEDYGPGFADSLTRHFARWRPGWPAVTHVMVDHSRAAMPISGSRIRTDVHRHRAWLPEPVYASFVRRICLLGGESSGKTSLAEALAREFGTLHVPEYGRELWVERRGCLRYSDMLAIARRQVAMEESAAGRAVRTVFCDTSPLTTLFYSHELFGTAEPELESLASRQYDLCVLCAPDFPFVQDGTRGGDALRRRQHDWYLRQLHDPGIPYLVATGPLAARIAQVSAALP
jgi:HTH-type transcriptional repressor of NAD biosynthesis genes